jgi:SRSO17 transposase
VLARQCRVPSRGLGSRSGAPQKNYVPEEVRFRTKPEIGLDQIDRALANGVRVAAWTFDELYGRDSKFLDGLEARDQAFVGEVPANFHGWVRKPEILRRAPKNRRKQGRSKKYPRVACRRPSCEVGNLLKYSPVFRGQSWQRYRIKDTNQGPKVWEIKWTTFWRKSADGIPGRRHVLIVAREVLTGELKYFVANRVPGEAGTSLRWLLRVAFGRWSIENCFRQAKEELGLDHYQVRGWRCVHRHYHITQLSHLFCARVRQQLDDTPDAAFNRLTIEQVRSAMDTWLSAAEMKPPARQQRYQAELAEQDYHQRRIAQACASHTKTTLARLRALGIDPERIKSCVPRGRRSGSEPQA